MKLSKFTPVGLVSFSAFLDSVRETGTGAVSEHLLTDPAFSTVIADVDVPDQQFDSRLEAAEFLDRLFTTAKLSDAERDAGLWAWLAARYFTVLCRTTKGQLRPGRARPLDSRGDELPALLPASARGSVFHSSCAPGRSRARVRCYADR